MLSGGRLIVAIRMQQSCSALNNSSDFPVDQSRLSHTDFAAEEAVTMGHKKPNSRNKKLKRPKTVLRLLDLEHSKGAVLNSLRAVSSQDSYGHAIDEFITWYLLRASTFF